MGHFCPPGSGSGSTYGSGSTDLIESGSNRDPGSTYGSGSTDLIESGSNRDPDPQPWFKLEEKSSSLKKEHLALKNFNFLHLWPVGHFGPSGSVFPMRIRIQPTKMNADPDPQHSHCIYCLGERPNGGWRCEQAALHAGGELPHEERHGPQLGGHAARLGAYHPYLLVRTWRVQSSIQSAM